MKEGENFDVESDDKICSVSCSGDQIDLDRLRRLVKDSRYICSACGRSAANADNLCSPEML